MSQFFKNIKKRQQVLSFFLFSQAKKRPVKLVAFFIRNLILQSVLHQGVHILVNDELVSEVRLYGMVVQV